MKRGIKSGFTLLELLVVFAIIATLLAFAAPSLLLLESTGLNASGRKLGDFLNLCRSEAISQRTAIRFSIVVDSTKPEEKFRKYAAWKWDKKSREFLQYSKWHSLPDSIVFSEKLPRNVPQSSYARNEPASIRGDYILDQKAESFEHLSPVFSKEKTSGGEEASGEKRTLRFLEFSPSGRAQVPWGEERNLIVAIRSGNIDIEKTTNWVQFTVDTLTGRTRVYRP